MYHQCKIQWRFKGQRFWIDYLQNDTQDFTALMVMDEMRGKQLSSDAVDAIAHNLTMRDGVPFPDEPLTEDFLTLSEVIGHGGVPGHHWRIVRVNEPDVARSHFDRWPDGRVWPAWVEAVGEKDAEGEQKYVAAYGELMKPGDAQPAVIETEHLLPDGTLTPMVFCAPSEAQPVGYWLAKFPVTLAEYEAFTRHSGFATAAEKEKAQRTFRNPEFNQDGSHPVVCVNWYDSIEFAKWGGLQLPTEQQWEYAAGGVSRRQYPWGDEAPNDDLLWWSGTTRRGGTCPVGEHALGASFFGAQDMAGNVWEWTCSKWKAR
jgi:hypothetical protein